MDEKLEMYYAFVKGNTGRWIFLVETDPSSAKAMQDDGIQIYPFLELLPEAQCERIKVNNFTVALTVHIKSELPLLLFFSRDAMPEEDHKHAKSGRAKNSDVPDEFKERIDCIP